MSKQQPPILSLRKGMPGLQRVRSIRGMTQTELANAVGCTAQHIGQIELGHYDCRSVLLRKIKIVLGCSFEALFTDTAAE